MNGLGGVLQQVEDDLFDFVGDHWHRAELRVELMDDLQRLEVESSDQVEIVAGDLHRLFQQGGQLAGGHLPIAAAAEGEHVGDDLRGP
ncbi:hypothetical protein D3C76_544320 [compost metagenome]